MEGNLNTLDIVFFIIIVFFALIALAKGFIRELFGKVCVIGSVAMCIFFAPKLVMLIMGTVKNVILANVLGYLLIFVASFLALKIIQMLFEQVADCDIMVSLNMTLGFVLGAVEGLVVVMLVIFLLKVQPIFDATAITKDSFFCRNISPKVIRTLPPIPKAVTAIEGGIKSATVVD